LHRTAIVIGGVDDRSLAAMAALCSVFDEVPLLEVDVRTAELIKYAANALLATLISFSNEIGHLAAGSGCDVTDVLGGVHLDRRLSPVVDGTRIEPGVLTYLAAGCGLGGSCFPKDVRALAAYGRELGLPLPLLDATMAVSDRQPHTVLDLVHRLLDTQGARMAVLGAACKPGTDDVRESPALPIIGDLRRAAATVVVHDPIALDNARDAIDDAEVVFHPDLGRALSGADAVVLVTAWADYRKLPDLLQGREIPVIDGRPDAVASHPRCNSDTGVGS
jgi:UDPglucose 6-dehydrogenase